MSPRSGSDLQLEVEVISVDVQPHRGDCGRCPFPPLSSSRHSISHFPPTTSCLLVNFPFSIPPRPHPNHPPSSPALQSQSVLTEPSLSSRSTVNYFCNALSNSQNYPCDVMNGTVAGHCVREETGFVFTFWKRGKLVWDKETSINIYL